MNKRYGKLWVVLLLVALAAGSLMLAGPALAEDSRIASKLYDAAFSHEYR